MKNDLTRLVVELYAERVAIMEMDGGIENAEEIAYTNIVQSIQRKMPESAERIPSLEYCKAASQHYRIAD